MRLLIFVMAIAVGSIAVMSLSTAIADYEAVNVGIPPTDAVQNINVQTSPWALSDTLVVTESYDDTVYFVSDGSIIFNVTEAVP